MFDRITQYLNPGIVKSSGDRFPLITFEGFSIKNKFYLLVVFKLEYWMIFDSKNSS